MSVRQCQGQQVGRAPIRECSDRLALVPASFVRIVVLGLHGGGRHGGPGVPVVTEPSVEFVAKDKGIVQIERDERGRDMPGQAFDDDAGLLHVGLDIVDRIETEVRVVRQGLRGLGGFRRLRQLRTPPGWSGKRSLRRRSVRFACDLAGTVADDGVVGPDRRRDSGSRLEHWTALRDHRPSGTWG